MSQYDQYIFGCVTFRIVGQIRIRREQSHQKKEYQGIILFFRRNGKYEFSTIKMLIRKISNQYIGISTLVLKTVVKQRIVPNITISGTTINVVLRFRSLGLRYEGRHCPFSKNEVSTILSKMTMSKVVFLSRSSSTLRWMSSLFYQIAYPPRSNRETNQSQVDIMNVIFTPKTILFGKGLRYS